MDHWIVKQLRAAVLSDLSNFIPEGHFEKKLEWATFDNLQGAEFFSYEMHWGFQAATLGRKLYFYSPSTLSARQVSAAEMLMHLGLLACAMAGQGACMRLAEQAEQLSLPDGNASEVGKQLQQQHLPTFEQNLLGGLKQYLLHLSRDEGEPFRPLLSSKDQNKPAKLF
jgi:hypothetical protein